MKTLKLLFFVALTSVLVSCGNDDDTTTNDSDIVNTWELTAFDYIGNSVATFPGEEPILTSFTGEAINIDSSFTFDENPNTFTAEGMYDIILSTTFEGETTTQTVNSEEFGLAFSDDGTWSINGDQLTITSNTNEVGVFEIVTLNANTLVLNVSQDVSVEANGGTQSSVIDVTYTFSN